MIPSRFWKMEVLIDNRRTCKTEAMLIPWKQFFETMLLALFRVWTCSGLVRTSVGRVMVD